MGRLANLHAFEILIFVVMTILLAMCLAVAPLVAVEEGKMRAEK
jgi:hypothetical protein